MALTGKKVKNVIVTLVVVGLLATTIAGCSTTYPYQAGAISGAIGAATGAVIDKNNRWRGAAIGGVAGGLIGGVITELATKASNEAATTRKPVRVQSGNVTVESVPIDNGEYTKCRKVRERVYQDNTLVKDSIKEICEGVKTEARY